MRLSLNLGPIKKPDFETAKALCDCQLINALGRALKGRLNGSAGSPVTSHKSRVTQ